MTDLDAELHHRREMEQSEVVRWINRDAATIKAEYRRDRSAIERGLSLVEAQGMDLELRALIIDAKRKGIAVDVLKALALEKFGTPEPNGSYIWLVIDEAQDAHDAAALAVEGKRREIEHKTMKGDGA